MLVSLRHKSAIDSRFSVEIICNLSTIRYPVTIEKSPQEHLFSVLAETAERFGAKTHECRTQLMSAIATQRTQRTQRIASATPQLSTPGALSVRQSCLNERRAVLPGVSQTPCELGQKLGSHSDTYCVATRLGTGRLQAWNASPAARPPC